ncbi:Hypothetical predicted protein [Paramuricea clavata]|uniref:Uncharacterized protein n=1 Tax=Paramuricea clavata TaxID=317549 RepID=A0A7D9HKP4_PARCT|nr:Hypothetical predicted protein [Paramuricea clavata]
MEDLLRESNLFLDEQGESTSFLADKEETKSQLLQQELEAEALCTSMKQNNLTQGHAETSNSPIGMELYTDALTKLTELCTKTQTGVTPLKLIGLDPPSWDGQKANFYMWKDMFTHTMSQARMSDDQVQITWLLKRGTMPLEYQTVIQDCKSMKSAWERLEKQIPASTVHHEIIQNFKQTPSLPPSSPRNASSMRQLANAISLFVRRMDDLGLKQDAMSTICFEPACNRLDQETVLRYAT